MADIFYATGGGIPLRSPALSLPAGLDPLDQGHQFGDLLFEGIRFSDMCIHQHIEHRGRLLASATKLGMRPPDPAEYDRTLFEAIRASGYTSGYARLILTRGNSGWGIETPADADARLYCLVGQLTVHSAADSALGAPQGIRVITARTRRVPHECMDATVKWGGVYCNNKMALREARSQGADDAILLTINGIVSEATVENVFWFDAIRAVLCTPRADRITNCLPGLTRAAIVHLARKAGLQVEEHYYIAAHLFRASEVFLTGTGAGVVPVTRLDGHPVGSGDVGPVTRDLTRRYLDFLRSTSTPISTTSAETPRRAPEHPQ